MAIQNSDKLIVGRGDESYQVYLSDSGLAKEDDVVSKVGGDSMQGPLTMEAIDPNKVRDTNRINTLGIYSNSSQSALRLGTAEDRMYVGQDDVSINGPLKVGEIQERNNGAGITVSSHLTAGQIRMAPGGYIGVGSSPRLKVYNKNTGNEGDGLLVVPRPAVSRRGFVIRGNDDLGVEKDMFYTFTNSTGTPDAVNYSGKMTSDTNLVNKGYVDDVIGTTMPKNINTLPLLST